LGQWVGNYGCGCGDEIVKIELNGDQMVCTKITGDNYVPAGQITWRCKMTSATTGTGESQYAHGGFSNPYWSPGKLTVKDNDHINFGGTNYTRKKV